MNPSIDLRIGSLIRVMSDIVIPDLKDGLAVEQARLVVSHLQVLRLQVDYAVYYEQLECRAAMGIGRKLQSLLSGGPLTQGAGARLFASLQTAGQHPAPAAVRRQYDDVNAAIEELLRAADEDGDEEFRDRARKLVLDQASAASLRNRSWFGAMGFEKPGTIDSIPDMIRKFATEMRGDSEF